MKQNFPVGLGKPTSATYRLLNAASWLLRVALAAAFLCPRWLIDLGCGDHQALQA